MLYRYERSSVFMSTSVSCQSRLSWRGRPSGQDPLSTNSVNHSSPCEKPLLSSRLRNFLDKSGVFNSVWNETREVTGVLQTSLSPGAGFLFFSTWERQIYYCQTWLKHTTWPDLSSLRIPSPSPLSLSPLEPPRALQHFKRLFKTTFIFPPSENEAESLVKSADSSS